MLWSKLWLQLCIFSLQFLEFVFKCLYMLLLIVQFVFHVLIIGLHWQLLIRNDLFWGIRLSTHHLLLLQLLLLFDIVLLTTVKLPWWNVLALAATRWNGALWTCCLSTATSGLRLTVWQFSQGENLRGAFILLIRSIIVNIIIGRLLWNIV